MIRLLVIFLALVNFSHAKQAKLVFSFSNQVEYDNFKTSSSFTLLNNGKYSFKTSTGGFHLCSDSPSGKFKGKLSDSDYKELLSLFKAVDKSCSQLSTCSTKKVEGMVDWKLLGWGDYSNKQYFFKSDTKRPKLFTKIFKLEKSLYKQPEVSFQMDKAKSAVDSYKVKITYKGSGHFELIKDSSSFIVMSKGKQRRLKSNNGKVIKLHSGDSSIITFDKGIHKLSEKDYLIYSPPHKEGINSCVVL